MKRFSRTYSSMASFLCGCGDFKTTFIPRHSARLNVAALVTSMVSSARMVDI
eukprot:CAMPEP_0114633166 /NCGR_PEP_ID=MMETSP0168-20121206/15308_1 /TAXON_ID=95228 ORGANISM="Vannella sp., Strain DIVA3 517/6/12" /NCGR_SAMPLE_ID=MMETSP0168 /ASSEMBLY_ACC=CAM_ASM_000044 /LENGTH=51 /DNA_ID=CAMNT_0001844795 /DNA_START=85 /DNA_END=240 /DNA_ORIENTATION=+